MKRLTTLKSQKGYSVPELLLVAGIVLMISSIFLAGVKSFSEQGKKVNATILALSLQSSFQAALKDVSNYPPDVQAILHDKTAEYSSLTFKSTWRSLSSAESAPVAEDLFKFGSSRGFNLNKDILEANDPTAVVQLYSKIQLVSDGTAPYPIYKVGYRVVFSDKKIPHLGSPLAQGQALDEFNDDDYLETLPHELYMGKSRTTDGVIGQVQCDPLVDVGIHGFNRDTGSPICIEKIYGPVLPKSFPRSLGFVEGYYGEDSLGKKPHITMSYEAFKPFRPPLNYIFNKITTSAFDPQVTSPGGLIQYVFIYRKNSPFYSGGTTTGMNTLTAKCPVQHYRVSRTSGVCRIVGSPIPIPGSGQCVREELPPDPVPPGWSPGTYTEPCDPNCSGSRLITETVVGTNVLCQYQAAACPNGGRHTAQLELMTSSSDCTLSVPEFRQAD